jgi:hypothetical protein
MLRDKLSKFKNEERGDILVLTAAMFTVFMLFLSVATDLAMAYNKRAKMYEIGHVMRQTRFTKDQDTLSRFMNVEEPGKEYAKGFNEYARKNGFKGKITVTYNETHPQAFGYSKRQFTIDMKLEDVYETMILRVVNINELPITVVIRGSGHKWHGGKSKIWYPKDNPNFTHYETTFPAIK